jgi:hypothetical protein
LSASLSGCGVAGTSTTGLSAGITIEMIAATQGSNFYLSMECGADAVIISPAADAASSLTQALGVVEENDTKVVFAGTSVPDRSLGASRITSDDADGGKVAAVSLGHMLAGTGSGRCRSWCC